MKMHSGVSQISELVVKNGFRARFSVFFGGFLVGFFEGLFVLEPGVLCTAVNIVIEVPRSWLSILESAPNLA
jgi:hypothetical protein